MSNVYGIWPRLATTTVAAIQGTAFLCYASGISIIGLTSGLEGPAEVSSPAGAIVEVVAFALFGAALVAIAFGRWRESSWSGPPFVLSQLLALAVGLPLATAADTVGKTIGLAVTCSAIVGIVGIVSGALGERESLDLRDETQDRDTQSRP